MTFDSYLSFILYAVAAGATLYALVSGKAPLSGREALRRERPLAYWFETLTVPALWVLAATLMRFDDDRATPILVAPIILRNPLDIFAALRSGQVPDVDDRVGRGFMRAALLLFWAGASAVIIWVLIDVVRNPPW